MIRTSEVVALDDLSSQMTIAMSAVDEARRMVTMGTDAYWSITEAATSLALCTYILTDLKKRAVYGAKAMVAGAI